MEFLSTTDFWIGLVKIIWINIILSGDNAVVIALAARSLPPEQQKKAIMFGSGAAVVLRIALTVVAAKLLELSFLQVIGGVLLAAAMPATVLMSRSMLVQEVLAAESGSKASMVCTAGDARALDNSSIVGWLFGGSFFSCGDWETRDARLQREKDQAHNNYMSRERARQGLPPN